MAETSKRRSDRVLITLPAKISGTNAAGKPFAENVTTVTVARNGAAIALRTPLVPGQEIVVCRLRTPDPRVAECRVVEQIGEQAGLKIFSVAFRKSAVGFWDIYFPPLPPGTGTAGRVLLGCKVCGTREVVHLELEALTVYNADRQLSRECPKCKKLTIWLESQQKTTKLPGLGPANATRLATAPRPAVENQRKHRRVAAEIPVCIRQAGADDDVATTVDISRGGLRFTSSRHYLTGAYIQVAVPYLPEAVNVFVDARVVHNAKVPSQEVYRFGIMYLAENEPSS